MRVLLTGVGGFIGAHCLQYFLTNTDWEIIGIDSFYHKGTPSRINDLVWANTASRVKIYQHDLATPLPETLINKIHNARIEDGLVIKDDIDIIINMASDSAVERSGDNPRACLTNNYNLVINMLEYARICKPKIFFQVSTDEVYGQADLENPHTEWSPIVPSNPYSASKAAQEAVAISYWRCFDVPVVITNTVNNFGEAQDPEKFIPKIMQCILNGIEIPIYEGGSRFYLYAKNHADVFVFLSNVEPTMYDGGKNQLPDRYNVTSTDRPYSNLEIANYVADVMDMPLKVKVISGETVRKGYDKQYALDNSKLSWMGWCPPIPFELGMDNTINWSLNNPHWII